jgi:hypothetical protein
MAFAETYFIFGTDHSLTGFSSDLCFLNQERRSIGGMHGGPYRSYDYTLTSCDIRSATYNVEYFGAASCDGGYAELIGIGVPGASQDFAYYEAFETSFDCFRLLHGFYLKAYGCKYPAEFVHFHVFGEIVEQPVVRDNHLLC